MDMFIIAIEFIKWPRIKDIRLFLNAKSVLHHFLWIQRQFASLYQKTLVMLVLKMFIKNNQENLNPHYWKMNSSEHLILSFEENVVTADIQFIILIDK